MYISKSMAQGTSRSAPLWCFPMVWSMVGIHKCLLNNWRDKAVAEPFRYTISGNLHHYLLWQKWAPLQRCGNWGSERGDTLARVAELVGFEHAVAVVAQPRWSHLLLLPTWHFWVLADSLPAREMSEFCSALSQGPKDSTGIGPEHLDPRLCWGWQGPELSGLRQRKEVD